MGGNNLPYETCVTLTERIRNWLSNSLRNNNVSDELKNTIRKEMESFEENGSTISYKFLKEIYSTFNSKESGLYFYEVLDGAKIMLPQLPVKERNPELEARIQKLKAQQKEKEYRQMTKNITNNNNNINTNEDSLGKQYKQLNKQLITVFNFILTVVCMFAFAYKATEYAIGYNLPLQLMAGLICGTIVFIADLYFIMKNDL